MLDGVHLFDVLYLLCVFEYFFVLTLEEKDFNSLMNSFDITDLSGQDGTVTKEFFSWGYRYSPHRNIVPHREDR